MNRTITATHSHARYNHTVFARHQSLVVDVPSMHDPFEVRRHTPTARFRGMSLEQDVVPAKYTPVFTPPRPRLRMHKESIAALFGGIVAACLITITALLMITHRKDAKSGSAASRIQHELRLFDESKSKTRFR